MTMTTAIDHDGSIFEFELLGPVAHGEAKARIRSLASDLEEIAPNFEWIDCYLRIVETRAGVPLFARRGMSMRFDICNDDGTWMTITTPPVVSVNHHARVSVHA